MNPGTQTTINNKIIACHLEEAHWNCELSRALNMQSTLPCGTLNSISYK
jgi:hypothetical protein